uniref:Uncharacterized protein n=1 Tax=Cucumis melo TaxID=3656 RepID=A0A9I9CLJ3_CUCME
MEWSRLLKLEWSWMQSNCWTCYEEQSSTRLSGNIPREGHLSTFNEASSFDNNPYLCREPLPIKCVTENPWKRH